MVKKVLVWPNEVLRRCGIPVSTFGGDLKQLEQDLEDTCIATQAAGLAASQIGVPLRAFVIVVDDDLVFMANPVIDVFDGVPELMEEGCLSFPGVAEEVARHRMVGVTYFDSDGVQHMLGLSGVAAQAAQHECDHLDGVLLPDKLSTMRRDQFNRRYRNQQRAQKA